MKNLTKLQQICPYCHSYTDEEKLDVSLNGDVAVDLDKAIIKGVEQDD